MGFVPKISVCLNKNCNYITVTDITGVYDVNDNPSGWEDPSTLDAVEVLSLTVEIIQNDVTIATENTLSQLPDPVTGQFSFSEIEVSELVSGEFTVEYNIRTASDIYKATITSFHACDVRCCIDAKWNAIAESGYTASNDGAGLVEEALALEGLYSSMVSSAASLNTKIRDNYLTKLQRLCGMTSKDCGCGSCDGCN